MCDDILHISDSCEDMLAVIALPTKLPDCGHSQGIAEYVAAKQQKHGELIERMRVEIQDLNSASEIEELQTRDLLKEELSLLKNEVNSINLGEIKSVEEWMLHSNRNKTRHVDINSFLHEFSSDFESTEKKRTKCIEEVLSKYKGEAIKLGGLSVENIECMYQNEIRDINSYTLKRAQSYEDERLTLQVHSQEILDKIQQELAGQATHFAELEAQRLWLKIQARESHRLMSDAVYNMTQENFKTREDVAQVTNHLVKSLSEFTSMLQLPDKYDINGEFWENWIMTLNVRLDVLDSLCKNVEGLLKTAVSSLLESFDLQINALTRTLVPLKERNSLPDDAEEIAQISCELQKLQQCQAEELNCLQSTWKNIIGTLTMKIEKIKTFVLDITSIWMNHLIRVNKVHSELETALDSSSNACQKLDKEKNSRIRNQMKAVREAKDLTKLDALCGVLQETYNQLTDVWEDTYESQLEMVENVKSNEVEKLIGDKLADVQEFLHIKYPKREWFAETFTPSLTAFSEIDPQIDTCITYLNAVDNRTLGMYEMLERYIPLCENSVRDESEEWIRQYLQRIVDTFERQLENMYETNKNDLNEARLSRSAEINVHKERMFSHCNGVKAVLTEINKHFDEVKLNQNNSLAEFHEKITFLTECRPNETSTQIKGTISQLEQDWSLLADSLELKISISTENCESKFDVLKKSNISFTKSALNFKNGGNYSPEELKMLSKELKQLEKLFTNQKKNVLNSYNNLNKNISRLVLDATIKQMQDKLEKVKLQDKTADMVDIIRSRLRTDINNMKTSGEIMRNKINELKSLRNHGFNLNLVNDILGMAQSRHDYLAFPGGETLLEMSKPTSKRDTSSNTNVGNVHTKTTPIIDLLFEFTNEDILSSQNNFLANSKTFLMNKYSSLLQSTHETFRDKSVMTGTKTSSPMKKEPKEGLEPDLATEHIDRLKTTLRLYNQECEMAWLDQSREFSNQIIDLKGIFNFLIRDYIEDIHESYMCSLANLENIFKAKVKADEINGESERDKTSKSVLLPLAHPTYQHKLDELYRLATILCRSQKSDYINHVTSYKGDLQSKHDEYVKLIKTTMTELGDIQNVVFNEESFKCLSEIVNAVTSSVSIQDLLVTNSDEIAPEAQVVYPTSIWSSLDGSCHDRLSNCSQDYGSTTSSQTNKLQECRRISINRIATEKVKQSAEKVQQLYDDAKSSYEMSDKTLTNWLKSLKCDIDQAKKVYTICK